jgi:glycosyltransferase involved in cell wall biosynthesis
MSTIYFDVTFTFNSGVVTGIQRVVRSIVKRRDVYTKSYGYKTQIVICFRNQYYKIDPEIALSSIPVTASFGMLVKRSFEFLRHRTQNSVNNLLYKSLHKVTFNVSEYVLKKIFAIIKLIRAVKVLSKSNFQQVVFEESDKLILLDAFWVYNLKKTLALPRSKNVKIYSVIYDLIPLTHPQFCEERGQKMFGEAFPLLIKYADRFVCISKAIKNELVTYTKKTLDVNLADRADFFYLGSDFQSNKSGNPASETNLEIQKHDNFWLTVSTIEPRKNHRYILDAFDILWSQGSELKLFIVGKIGWKCEDIIDRLAGHQMLNKKLFVFHDMDDRSLEYCYLKSKGLIFSSVTEGFGLPIVEAMSRGVPVLCSDIEVFREIGEDYPRYFNINNPMSLVDLLSSNFSNKPKTSWITWDDSSKLLAEKIMKL